MDSKINFDDRMQQIIRTFHGRKPKMLLHVCCAPCSSAVMERLEEAFRLVVFFDNPNLASQEEHHLRATETRRLVALTGLAEQLIMTDYHPESFYNAIHGAEKEPEGGHRCQACFRLRLENAARAAKATDCDWFTTTLTISPHKNAQMLNSLGEEIGLAVGVPFLPSDFKKRGGYQRSLILSREHSLYRQSFCGCVFSKKAWEERKASQQKTGEIGL
jgi:predicted adenine nucleotide alpha hydrolase (AANH) superfamily ATPase